MEDKTANVACVLFSSLQRDMGDVQLVTKTRLTLSQGPVTGDPPAFTLPPRNVRVSPGGVARLDGKVRATSAQTHSLVLFIGYCSGHSAGSSHHSEFIIFQCFFLKVFFIKVRKLSQLHTGQLPSGISHPPGVEAPRSQNHSIGECLCRSSRCVLCVS